MLIIYVSIFSCFFVNKDIDITNSFGFPAPTLRDEEDELLQLAIQQSLLEYGGVNLEEREGEENGDGDDDEMLQR